MEKYISNINSNKNDNQREIKSNIEHLSNNFYDFKPGVILI